MSVSRPLSTAFVAHNAVPLIGERAASRGGIATEGYDERADAKSALSVRAPASRTGSNGGNRDAFGGPLDRLKSVTSRLPAGTGRAFRVRTHLPSPRQRCAAHRRARRNERAHRDGRWR